MYNGKQIVNQLLTRKRLKISPPKKVNYGDDPVHIGATKKDEMCNFYMMYWVHGKRPVVPQTCFSNGPPHWSWASWRLKNIPDEEASTL